jgi:Fe-S oxidoreductase
MIIGLAATAVTLVLAGRRVAFLAGVALAGQPAPDRVENVTRRVGDAIKSQVVEVFGQKKLLKWSVPGVAHFFVFWAFVILATVYFEAYAVMISRDPHWHWWIFNSWSVLGFLQDFIAVMCLLGIIAFWQIRLKNSPERLGRKSRFSGSHLGGAYLVLFMIFNVLWTLFLFRGAIEAHETSGGYGKAAFVSHALGQVLPDSTALIGIGLLLHIGIMLVFLIDVLHSKHLHIFVAPVNVLFGRKPVALGAMKPLTSAGKPVTLDDLEDMDDETTLGVGKIEDFSWKGILDFYSCTECGRCQSQCPAWNTEKPLSPKLLIMGLRDHALQKAPYLLADEDKRAALPEDVLRIAEKPLVGETVDNAYNPHEGAVIDDDVLWSCTSCGACVNQCPVDIEHVDHIMDMRRYQVLVESNFPAELNGLFRGLENKGNPWNLSPTARMEWAQGLDFDVKVLGEDVESMDDVDWLFWVGCAGAYEDRAKKTTRAVAELFHMADVDFAVLGNGETCNGDPARRAGNEFVFQGLAQQNIETFKEMKVKKVVTTCPHCLNTLKNEYRQLGVELEVVHHTQLLNRLVREKKLTPVAVNGGPKRALTYHDPCYLGRHNQVYSPPRELLTVIPDAELNEMPRNSERSFCCGAGGARMWMEETIGERVNVNRTKEAVATGADQIAVGCPFCRVMLEDGLTAEQAEGNAREEVEVLDVAQLLLASVKGEAPKAKAKTPAGAAVAAKPSAADSTQTASTITETADAGPNAKASGGGSLFDTPAAEQQQEEKAANPAAQSKGGSLFDTPAPEARSDEKPVTEEATDMAGEGGGSLFDLGPQKSEETRPAEVKEQPEPAKAAAQESGATSAGGSLFDIAAPEQEAKAEPAAEPAQAEPEARAETETSRTGQAGPAAEASGFGGGSLFDIKAKHEEQPAGAGSSPQGGQPDETDETDETEEAAEATPPAEPVEADEAPADAQPEEATEEAAEQPAQQDAKPATKPASGEAHQPKTDADISGTGSLFDL